MALKEEMEQWVRMWTDIKLRELLLLVLNEDCRSPLTLAAQQINGSDKEKERKREVLM